MHWSWGGDRGNGSCDAIEQGVDVVAEETGTRYHHEGNYRDQQSIFDVNDAALVAAEAVDRIEHLKQLMEHLKILGEVGANDRRRVAVPASTIYPSLIQSPG